MIPLHAEAAQDADLFVESQDELRHPRPMAIGIEIIGQEREETNDPGGWRKDELRAVGAAAWEHDGEAEVDPRDVFDRRIPEPPEAAPDAFSDVLLGSEIHSFLPLVGLLVPGLATARVVTFPYTLSLPTDNRPPTVACFRRAMVTLGSCGRIRPVVRGAHYDGEGLPPAPHRAPSNDRLTMSAMPPELAPTAGPTPPSHRGRTLSKSDFKLARTCEAKLFFRENGFPDNRADDPFLEMLAQGGYMVEGLAKARYPEGCQLSYGRDSAAAWAVTQEALRQENVTLFEATLLAGRRMARVDILVKRGTTIRLIEVKAKSIDRQDHIAQRELGKGGAFRTKAKAATILSDWAPYLEDVTYQVLLAEELLPECRVEPFLAMVDSSAICRRDGVFDLFDRLPAAATGDDRYAPQFLGTADDLSLLPIVCEIDVASEVALLREEVRLAAARMEALLDAPLDAFERIHDHRCRDCEFRGAGTAPDGFRTCWGDAADVRPHVLDLYSAGKVKIDGEPLVRVLKSRGTVSLLDVPEGALSRKDGTSGPISERQRRQIHHTRSGEPFVAPTLAARLASIPQPMHFVDFEACRVALPYHAGMRPYGQLAFQWSCHAIAVPGERPRHYDWLNVEDRWPSGAFVESLRACVGEEGSILTWSKFERSTLKDLRDQLDRRKMLTAALDAWFDALPSRLVDLMEIAESEYFHPKMGGRSSIKVVLDAVWQADPKVRQQCAEWFSKPLSAEADPYKALSPLIVDGVEQGIHDGTGAIRAYELMHFSESARSPEVRESWSKLLKQYCELDTLSMVLIYEHWRRVTGLAAAPQP